MPTQFPRLIICAALSWIPAHAGICIEKEPPTPKHEFRLLAGYSPDSPDWLGTARDRSFIMVETGYSYRCWSWKNASLSYGVSLIPVAIVRQPRQTAFLVPTPGVSFIGNIPAHSVYAFGIQPVGLYAEFRRHDRFHPILEGNGGFVVSTEPIPEQGVNATGINFIFNGGVGLRWNTRPRNAVTAGYRWVHVSNAETTTNNPGLDNNVFYLAYSFLR